MATPLAARRAILLTSYMTGSPDGKNLGTPGYSYDFVTQLFEPLLARFGKVIPVYNPQQSLDEAIMAARQEGYQPIHVSFLPFQDLVLADDAPNVVVPAWEFPDVPDEPFDNNHQNDWKPVAAQCDMVLVGGQFTVDTLVRGGIAKPIRIVPVLTPQEYFELPMWNPKQCSRLDCQAVVFDGSRDTDWVAPKSIKMPASFRTIRKSYEQALKETMRMIFGKRYQRLSDSIKDRRTEKRKQQGRSQGPINLAYESVSSVDLSGIVYTSIFNPDDGRKNWRDMLSGFLLALGDRPDVTLVLKLITSRATPIERLIHGYLSQGIPHQCKIVIVYGFLDDRQMCQLAQASTFYLQTTKAEGNCLPLMNYLGAGRPGISPAHTAIGDYFDEELGFVIESHPEPAAWPQDPRWRIRTSWARMVWPSIVEQLQASYALATGPAEQYDAMGRRARQRLSNWASEAAVETRLHAALEELHTLTYGTTSGSDVPTATSDRLVA